MQTYPNRNRILPPAQKLVLLAMLVILAGCGQPRESKSGETAVPEKTTIPTGKDQAAGDGLAASTLPPEESPRRVETRTAKISDSEFWDAALAGDLNKVRQAADSGVNVNSTDDQSRTALMLASFNGHTPVVKLLLEKGASLGHRDAVGRTALMFAATGANAETVELLLAEGAEVNAVDSGEGFTALMHAAAEGQVQVVQLLLKYKADPDLRDVDDDTALDFASRNGHTEVVRLLA